MEKKSYTNIGRNMLEFGISFNISKKSKNIKMKKKSFLLKIITFMLKASNNHFGDRSKIKIPKIRPFAKIAKKCRKIQAIYCHG